MSATVMVEQAGYIPGECNIGGAGVRRRMIIGWASVLFAILFAAALLTLPRYHLLRFGVTVPVFAAALCFIQARVRFCAGLGLSGKFAMGSGAETLMDVQEESYRQVDRYRSLQLILAAAFIGASAGTALFIAPW